MDQSPSLMPLPRVAKTREDDAGINMLDKGKAVASVKRRLAEDATDPFFLFYFIFLYHFIDLEAEPMMVVWWSIHVGPSLGI